MEVVVDASWLRPREVGGSEITLKRTLAAGRTLPSLKDGSDRVRVLGTRRSLGALQVPSESRLCALPPLDRIHGKAWIAADVAVGAQYMRMLRADVIWCPGNFGCFGLRSIPQLITIHDLQHRHCPENLNPRTVRWRESLFLRNLTLRSSFAVPSDAVADDVIATYGLDRAAVSVVTPGSDHMPEGGEGLRRPDFLPDCDGYICYPATYHSHKNHKMLLEAYAVAVRNGVTWPLVCTGLGSKPPAGLIKHVDDLGIGGQVSLLNKRSDEECLGLIANASLFVFPSLFEGYGLPVAEAARAGVPVIASPRAPSTSRTMEWVSRGLTVCEVRGDLPRSHYVESWANAILEHFSRPVDVVSSPTMAPTWEQAAQQLMESARAAAFV